jgi:hypothetical protein
MGDRSVPMSLKTSNVGRHFQCPDILHDRQPIGAGVRAVTVLRPIAREVRHLQVGVIIRAIVAVYPVGRRLERLACKRTAAEGALPVLVDRPLPDDY